MARPSGSLLLPIVLPKPLSEPGNGDARSLVHRSCSSADVTAFVPWHDNVVDGPSMGGVAMGCSDGSIYLFHRSSIKKADTDSRRSTKLLISSQESEGLYHSRPTSRSSSPSSASASHLNLHSPSLQMTSRSRITSGVVKEQVEAPKNYVDFDDEPEKLKDMLAGKGAGKAKAPPSPDATSTMTEKTVVSDTTSRVSPQRGSIGRRMGDRIGDALSFTSAMNSPHMSPALHAAAASPRMSPSSKRHSHSSPSTPNIPTIALEDSAGAHSTTISISMSLRCHIIPRRFGEDQGNSISAIRPLASDRLVVALQESGDLNAYAVSDGRCVHTLSLDSVPFVPAGGADDAPNEHDVWVWKHLAVYPHGESSLVLATASLDAAIASASRDYHSEDDHSRARAVLIELFPGDEGLRECRMEKVGEWVYDGLVEDASLHHLSAESFTFYYFDRHSHLITRRLDLSSPVPLTHSLQRPHSPHRLPLPNPFKALQHGMRSAESVTISASEAEKDVGKERVWVGDAFDCGQLLNEGPMSAMRAHNVGGRLRALVWSETELMVFELHSQNYARVLFTLPASSVREAQWLDDDLIALAFHDRVECFSLRWVDADNDDVLRTQTELPDHVNVQPMKAYAYPLGDYQALTFISHSEIITTSVGASGCRRLRLVSGLDDGGHCKTRSTTLWKAVKDEGSKTHVTCMLPLEIDHILLGHSDGRLSRTSLASLVAQPGVPAATSRTVLEGSVTRLHIVRNERTLERYVLGGTDDGSIVFWHLDNLEVCAQWTIFTAPLAAALQFRDLKSGPLRGCVLCVSLDGTIAVVAVDGLQFLYLIPGAAAPLHRICLGTDNLLLIYTDRRARLWDVQTKEFWRSMTQDKAEELLSQGGWVDISLADATKSYNSTVATLAGAVHTSDSASTASLDIEDLVSETIRDGQGTASIHRKRNVARLTAVLSALLTPGVDEDIDKTCHTCLGVAFPQSIIGHSSKGTCSLLESSDSGQTWCISPDVSASRALAIVAVLKSLSTYDGYHEPCQSVTAFYTTALKDTIGELYQAPNLVYLARVWLRSSNDMRSAIRVLFDTTISTLRDAEAMAFADKWQHDLPCLQPDADKQSDTAALALFLCGFLAVENYSLMSPSTLTDISKSISLYLHDEQCPHRVLAIDLCSRGYEIWQHYVDAMELLRSLFTWATNARKEAISSQNIGSQARVAVLQIASNHTPLFMTTLALDILNPKTMEHRKSVMQLVALLIRKRPLVIYPNLPRLMEAVVKSLDPNVTASRDAVLDAATEIIGYVVKKFPTVDFHMASQRLAVGTSEGAIVMYDLKTGTRLYVLEGHKRVPAACSFSPDGRRLVTVSLEEGTVLVWKVGTSFTSFFNPGAPPRQGHSGSEPFKSLPFNVGQEAEMTTAETLDYVRFEWPADRSVKLKIRESVLTFST